MRGTKRLEKLLIQCITDNQENAYRLAYSYVRNKEDALDIVQDAIHKAFLSMEKLKQTGSLRSWFFRIVVTTSLDYLRKQRRVHVMDDEHLELVLPSSQDRYPNLDLARSLEELPEKYRVVIILRYFEDMKIEEIADVLQENLSTVKTRLYQGLQRLRVNLGEHEQEEEHQLG
ncbi:RNA polymerase sigma factor SigV [Paenibacillus sp. JCM 10914]|uniref:sigma-70 family RNA polymerase sigma factor n=1 Tax=Paenibacillus sp. JCM 10914 TaxID=1236974 RepID=UPI0003CC5C1B|nr:sigma-70 family RNA polymerase sigma factor [Paenibacillus sp. JCM 10914]GAE06007.1 RNA polymerase sigma factor SigV [Paenibacillus sp. JCM 10914]